MLSSGCLWAMGLWLREREREREGERERERGGHCIASDLMEVAALESDHYTEMVL